MVSRESKLMPGGVPRWVRCYDNGGETADQYTVVYTGRYEKGSGQYRACAYVGMSAEPTHPQGFCQHGESREPIDTLGGNGRGYCRPPDFGRFCHLGQRITFADLPEACQRIVIEDYRALWGLTS